MFYKLPYEKRAKSCIIEEKRLSKIIFTKQDKLLIPLKTKNICLQSETILFL